MIPLPDSIRYHIFPYAPFTEPLPMPAVDPSDPDGAMCFTINRAYLPYLLGALTVYLYEDAWNTSDREVAREAIERFQLLLAILSGDGDCDVTTFDVRQNTTDPCELEKTYDGIIWQQFADLTLCPTPPRTTRYNPTTDSMEVSTDGGVTWTPAPEIDPRIINTFPPASSKCDAAASMVRYISDFIDLVVDMVTAGTALTAAISLIAGFLALIGAAFAALVLLMIDLFTFVTSTGASIVAAAFTSEVYDDLLCIFFCHVDDDGRLNADSLAAALSDINGQIGGVAAAALTVMFALTGFAGLNNAGAAGLDTDDCSGCGCGEWCITNDSTDNSDGWSVQFGGTYASALGWQPTDVASGGLHYRDLELLLNLGSTHHLTEIGMEFDFVTGDWDSGALNSWGIFCGLGTPFGLSHVATHSETVDGTNLTWIMTLDDDIDQVYLEIVTSTTAAASYSGAATLKNVTLRGVGTKPTLIGWIDC